MGLPKGRREKGILIYGSEWLPSEISAREIRYNPRLGLGFLDDDPRRAPTSSQAFGALGSGDEIPQIVCVVGEAGRRCCS